MTASAHEPAYPRARFSWKLALVVWTVIVIGFTASNFAMYAVKEMPIPLWQVFYWVATEWYLWALLAPAILLLTCKVPITRASWRRWLPVHLLGAITAIFLHETLYVLLERFAQSDLNAPTELSRHLLLYYTKRTPFDLLVYCTLVGIGMGGSLYRRAQERERRATQLESQLTKAQLDVLRNQLQPHFLFNTLNTISSLVHSDVEAADRVVSRLGDMLRLSLQHDGRHEVTLREELDFLGHYVEIQRSRFRDRLSVSVVVPPALLDGQVPTFILQPLVENAIRHGIEPRTAPGQVEVRASRDGEQLVLEVADNGPGLVDPPPGGSGNGRGIGLTNTRARLLQLYGDRQAITLANRPEGGVMVRLEIPWRVAAAEGNHG
jgi:two-component system, LytTR family, sensor kinase